jgi:hypothetical protein
MKEKEMGIDSDNWYVEGGPKLNKYFKDMGISFAGDTTSMDMGIVRGNWMPVSWTDRQRIPINTLRFFKTKKDTIDRDKTADSTGVAPKVWTLKEYDTNRIYRVSECSEEGFCILNNSGEPTCFRHEDFDEHFYRPETLSPSGQVWVDLDVKDYLIQLTIKELSFVVDNRDEIKGLGISDYSGLVALLRKYNKNCLWHFTKKRILYGISTVRYLVWEQMR